MQNDTENESNFLEKPFFIWTIIGLIVYSTITFSIETIPDLSPSHRAFLYYSEWVVMCIFSAEYLARVYFAKQKLKYIFSFFGLIDLIAIIPFYLSLGGGGSAIRLLRLIRIARLLKLARYNKAIKRFAHALALAKEELVIFLIASFIMFYIAAVGIYHFEHAAQPEVYKSIFDSLWWAVATLTTVGYGDIYPITVGGKIFTFFILMIGLGLIAVPTGIIVSAITSTRNQELASQDDNNTSK